MEVPARNEVLIVGAGPVGVTLANLLGRYGISAVVIDKAADVLTHPRAIALDNEALRILQMAGLSEDAFARVAIPQVRMRSPYVGEFARFNTTGCLDGHPKLANFFQPDLEHALRRELTCHSQIMLMPQTELIGFHETDTGIAAELQFADGQRRTVSTNYLIGADGASSKVRELLRLGFQGSTYTEDWLIVDARQSQKPIDHIEFICDPKRPTPHMPAPDGRERWEFMLQSGETREQMLNPDKIRELLAPWAAADEVTIERSAIYRFHARVVERFQKGRVFLVGDAAHITPPFVGQGLCAGLRDAANLGWKLAWVLKCRAAPSILESYDTERRPHAADMIQLATRMGKLIMPSSKLNAIFIHGLLRLLRVVPAIKRWIDELKFKPQNRFHQGLFVAGPSASALQRGSNFPQALLRHGDGRQLWSDDVLGEQLTLVGFGVDPHSLVDVASLENWKAAGGHCIQICYRGQTLHRGIGTNVWEDVSGAFMPAVAADGWLALVRPDRTLISEGSASVAGKLIAETLALLGAVTAISGC